MGLDLGLENKPIFNGKTKPGLILTPSKLERIFKEPRFLVNNMGLDLGLEKPAQAHILPNLQNKAMQAAT